jgi:hypothetical protein
MMLFVFLSAAAPISATCAATPFTLSKPAAPKPVARVETPPKPVKPQAVASTVKPKPKVKPLADCDKPKKG